jgi:hypothetical protein
MRTRNAALASLLVLALTSLPAFAKDFEIVKISPAVDYTPDITFNYGPQSHPKPRAQQWIEVEVNLESNVDWTDELTVKYYILIDGQCLTGQVTHIDVPRGRDLYSVMYVPPVTIQRILNGNPLSPNDIQDVGVELVINGQVLDTKSWKTPGSQQWWENQQQVPGKVLNKDQTPFAALIWDRYLPCKVPVVGQ